ncbi:MAG: CPBP family intramembrane metalloprotease [Sedimentisphaerales bacterium]|nr:CPBP family intramembrane metalloprotease [Sedimentisphaerales bacterium]
MKAAAVLSVVAAGLWLVMFSPWTKEAVPFWPAMAFSSGFLAVSALAVDRKRAKPLYTFRWWYIPLGLASAVALYLVFFVGHKIAVAILPFASDQVGLVYQTRSQGQLWIIGLLLLAWIGPAEEIFWRGFVQERFSERSGPFAALVLASAIYTLVHLWSFNLMLLAAAGICGVFWGAMFYRFRSVWPGLISHAVWDVLIFVFLPMH